MNQTKEAFLSLDALSLSTYKGSVFELVSVEANSSDLVAFCGYHGTGKSALLLSIAGHMRTSSGKLYVDGIDASSAAGRRHIQAISGKAVFDGINNLPEALSPRTLLKAETQDVASLIRFAERFEGVNQDQETASYKGLPSKGMHGAKLKLSAQEREEVFVRYLRAWDLEKLADTQIRNLSSKQRARLGIALACVDDVRLVVVNDVEDELTLNQSRDLMILLKRVAHNCGICICVAVVERALAQEADSIVHLTKEGK